MNMMIIKALVLLLVSAATVSVCEGFITHTNHTKSSFHTTTTLHLIQNDDIEPNMREPLTKHSGEYLVEFAIGTPPLKAFANMDTGSTLTWIQCHPCKHCYPQSTPKFNRKASSTFEIVPYSAPECFSDGFYVDIGIHGRCNYSVEYGDKATSEGFIAKDKMRIGSLTIPEFTMGCGVENRGKFSPRASGIIGLGNTRDSLIGQLGQLIHNKFSYCLSRKSGYLSLGEADGSSISTPIVSKKHYPHYYVTLNAIQIGKIRVPFTDSSKIKKGNLIIDSGTPPIYLPRKLYERVREEISKQVKSERVDNVKKYTLCYEAHEFEAPKIVFHFKGAKVKLRQFNMFRKVSKKVVCLALRPTDDESDPGIYGSLAQRHFLIGYDLGKQLISFKPADCGV